MFVVTADDEDIFLEVHLAPRSFFGRVVNAVRYVFGRRAPWGDFDEIILSRTDALLLGDELIEFAEGQGHPFEPNDVY